jgi:hypothetical protein
VNDRNNVRARPHIGEIVSFGLLLSLVIAYRASAYSDIAIGFVIPLAIFTILSGYIGGIAFALVRLKRFGIRGALAVWTTVGLYLAVIMIAWIADDFELSIVTWALPIFVNPALIVFHALNAIRVNRRIAAVYCVGILVVVAAYIWTPMLSFRLLVRSVGPSMKAALADPGIVQKFPNARDYSVGPTYVQFSYDHAWLPLPVDDYLIYEPGASGFEAVARRYRVNNGTRCHVDGMAVASGFYALSVDCG